MRKATIGLVLLGIGLLFGAILAGNFGVGAWILDGRPDKVILGRVEQKSITPPGLSDLNRAFREVAQNVKPSVVYINVIGKEVKTPNDQFHQFENQIPGMRRRENSAGSGVIVSKEGYIITNHHVIEGGEQIRVLLEDKREYEAQIIGSDPSTDLAVIKIQPNTDIPVAPIGDDRQLAVGDWVVAIGSPFRLTSTVTAGIVSALGRQIGIIDANAMPIEDFIQTDAAINPGNSGGALVNLNGELVGINTAIATEGGSYEGYGFAVPVGLVMRVTQDLIRYGSIQRGYLGISISALTAQYARQLGLPRVEGVLVTAITPNGAAAQAGMSAGDLILRINGREVNETNQLQRTIAMNRPGEQVQVEFLRDGQRLTLPVTLLAKERSGFGSFFAPSTPAPKPIPPLKNLEDWGFEIRPLSEQERQKWGNGVWITQVSPNKPAAKGQLPNNALLAAIEEQKVNSLDDLKTLLPMLSKNGKALTFKIKTADGTARFYRIDPPQTPK